MSDRIELKLPIKAEYVSLARLTASGVASRLGFDIETIEDIKVALSEVCNKFINVGTKAEVYLIVFEISGKKLSISFDCEDKGLKCAFDNETDVFSISIINALMDSVEFCPEGRYLITMSKSLEGNA